MQQFFLSYPKSGRTWIRFMINDYLARQCGIEVGRDVRNLFDIEKALGPRYPFQWTHLTAAMLMDLPYWSMGAIDYRPFKGARFILLTRHFHATMASAYRHAVHRIMRFDGPIADFIRSPVYGAVKLVTLMNMWEVIEPGLAGREIVSYERTLDDPAATLRRCLTFAAVPVDETLLEQAVEAGSFERMQQAGLSPAYAGTPLAPADPANPDSFKVRTGGNRDAHEILSDDDRAYIDRIAEDLLVNPGALHLAGLWNREVARANLAVA